MKRSKNYQLLNFLNRSHSKRHRIIFGAAAMLGVGVVTRSSILAKEVWRSIQHNHYKNAFRRCGWYAAHGWPQFQFVEDHFFDFTDGLSETEIEATRQFNQRSSKRMTKYNVLSNELYALAAKIHLRLSASDEAVSDLVDEFYTVANELIKSLPVDNKITKKTAGGTYSKTFTADARVVLLAFSKLFPIENWKWYVVSGTFLGLVREKGFLSHDVDIDIGINIEDFDFQALIDVLSTTEDFVIKKIDEQIEIQRQNDNKFTFKKHLVLIKLIHKSGLAVDIFVHHKDGDVRWHGSCIHRWDNKEFVLTTRDLEGIPVLAPDNEDLYLSENYGDWRTPKYDFNCTTDTNNLVITKNFLSIAIFLKRMVFLLASKDPKGVQLKNALIKHNVLVPSKGGLRVNQYI